MFEMTEEEADALDEYYTKNLPKIDGKKGGVISRSGFRMVSLDRLSENYLMTMAFATQKSPTELISEMIRKEIKAKMA
jgi:hypothetical protein